MSSMFFTAFESHWGESLSPALQNTFRQIYKTLVDMMESPESCQAFLYWNGGTESYATQGEGHHKGLVENTSVAKRTMRLLASTTWQSAKECVWDRLVSPNQGAP